MEHTKLTIGLLEQEAEARVRSMRWRRRLVFLAVAIVTGILAWEFNTNLIVTLTPSLKHHVYFKSGGIEKLQKGDYVLFKLENDIYAKPDDIILKEVVCLEGESLEVTSDKRFFCNGVFLNKAKDYTRAGEKLNHFAYNGIIPEGSFFVIGHHKDSYDSRYFGFIHKEQMAESARPFFAKRNVASTKENDKNDKVEG